MQALDLALVLGVGVVDDGELLLVGVVAGIDADLLDVLDGLHRRRGEEMDVGHERHVGEAGGGELGADVAQGARGRDVGRGDAHDLATDLGELDALAHGRRDVLRVGGRHRLHANRVGTSDADGTDHHFGGGAADGGEAGGAVGHGSWER